MTTEKEPYYAGRPLKFECPKELEGRINEYFVECDKGKELEVLSKRGEVVKYTQAMPYTLEGLGRHLDCSTELLRNYTQKPAFHAILSRARQKIWESWIQLGALGQYNPRIVAMNLAANNKQYNIVKQTESHDTLTIEQKLRQAKQIEEHVPEAEVEKIEGESDGNK